MDDDTEDTFRQIIAWLRGDSVPREIVPYNLELTQRAVDLLHDLQSYQLAVDGEIEWEKFQQEYVGKR